MKRKKDKCSKSESCCEFKYLNNVLGKPGDIVEVIPSNDYNIASVQKIVCDKQLEWLWAEAAGGVMSDTGAAIDVDCNGNFYVTGTFEGTHACFGQFILTNGGSGFPSGNTFIAKLTPDCSWEWVKSASNVSYAGGTGISTDCNGHIYVTGFFSGTQANICGCPITSKNESNNGFVAKLDTNGNCVWATIAGGSEDTDQCTPSSISVDCNGNSYVTGNFTGTKGICFGTITLSSIGEQDNNPEADIFVARVNSKGDWVWARRAGSDSSDNGAGITVDCNSNIYVTGFFQGTEGCFGDIKLPKKFDPNNQNNFTTSDIFIAKLNLNGNWIWARSAGGVDNDGGRGISVDCDQNVYVTGSFESTQACFGQFTLSSQGNSDVFVAKLDSGGNWMWVERATGPGTNSGNAIKVDCKGNPYITGYFSDTMVFGENSIICATSIGGLDTFVAKLDSNGNWLLARETGGIMNDEGNGIAVDCNGKVYVIGSFAGTISNLDNKTITSKGDSDVFIAKLSSTNLGTLGFLGDYAQPNELAQVCFPGGVILEDIFNQDLKPGQKYYIDCKCQLSTCCKCAKQFVGVACDKDKMITGIKDNCCIKH